MTGQDGRPAALTIGEFARRSGLSPKALRLYARSGLLRPAEVDPVTGYRRYAPDQLVRACRIRLLRQLEMPLAVVAEVLAGSDEQAMSRLDRWWVRQEASMCARRGSFELLRADLSRSEGDPPAYPVSVRRQGETKLATIRREVDQPALVDTMTRGGVEIRDYLRAAGAEPATESWWIFYGMVTPERAAPVEVCVPFAGTVDPAGPITIRVEPAHTEAYCTVVRDDCFYPRIMAAYDAVGGWVRESGHRWSAPSREIYFADWDEISGSDPFVHIAQPIR